MPLASDFLAEQFPLVEVLFEDFQAGERVVEFEQFLLGEVLDGQDFRDPVADPFGFVVTVGFGQAFSTEVGGDALEQWKQSLAFGWQRGRAGFSQEFNAGFKLVVGADAGFDDAKAPAAMGGNHEDAELLHLPVANGGERADGVRFGRGTDFAAFFDEADAEGCVGLHAGGGHVEVALLENFERQHAAREEYGVEREERDAHRFDGVAGGRADEVEPTHLSAPRPSAA